MADMFSFLSPLEMVKARYQAEHLTELMNAKDKSALSLEGLGEKSNASFEQVLMAKYGGFQDSGMALMGTLNRADDEAWEREQDGGTGGSIFSSFIAQSAYLSNPAMVRFLAKQGEEGSLDPLEFLNAEEGGLPDIGKILSGSGPAGQVDQSLERVEEELADRAAERLGENSPMDPDFLRRHPYLTNLIARQETVAGFFRDHPQAAQRVVDESRATDEIFLGYETGDDLLSSLLGFSAV